LGGSLSREARRAITAVEKRVAEVVARLPFAPGRRLLVAISGGPDSVATLHALHRISGRFDFELAAAHLNHGIRELESDRDEQFVRELCGRLRIELVVERAHGLKHANLEERARQLRYDFLNRTAEALAAQFIALGHHQDDQAETVLLRLLRGTGIGGLAAMAEVGPGRLVRPLLSLGRVAILAYLEAIEADYVVDSSNLEGRALRNRVRAGLLPSLACHYSAGISRRLAELASEMRDVDSFMTAEACRSLDIRMIQPLGKSQDSSCWMDLRGFKSISPALARAMMRELVRRRIGDLRRVERVHIEAMRHLASGENPSSTVILPRGWIFRREYDTAVLEEAAALGTRGASATNGSEVTLMPGENPLSVGGSTLTVREIAAGDECFPFEPWHPPTRFEAYFDAAKVPLLTARSIRPGDRIRPLGVCGSRKIHDVFVDYKVKVASRKSWPLVVSGNEVIWIPGLVRSAVALVTPRSKKVLHLCAHSLPDGLKARLPGL
jgi:tRNA(Ile)-lysidine synthase